VDSQPRWIEFLPAWPRNLPSGKIEGVALRSQIILKELTWSEKSVFVVLRSAIAQKVQLKFAGEIKASIGDKKVKIQKKLTILSFISLYTRCYDKYIIEVILNPVFGL
jgi:hypothetical protein